jgi:hypothetical protein
MDIPSGTFISAFLTPIITAGAAVLAVVIGNRLSYARTYKEKIWDLRRQTYGVILSELAAVERICDDADGYISERGYEEYWNNKARERHDAEIANHMGIIQRRFSDDYLILSDAFIGLHDKLMKEMASDPYNALPPDEHETFSEAIRKYRPLLTTLARNEMKIQKKWSFFRP